MKGQTPQVNELQELLLSIPKSFNTVYLVIDALDECKVGDCRDELLKAFQAFQASMKLLVTSRPHIEDLSENLALASQIKLRAVESDIRDYVYKQLETRKMKKILGKDEKLKTEIVTSIVAGANGMQVFLETHFPSPCPKTDMMATLGSSYRLYKFKLSWIKLQKAKSEHV